jgi:thymidylate synthase (FAD)
MKIVEPGFEILSPLDGTGALAVDQMLSLVERAGRTCYKSEERIGPGTAEKFVRMVIDRGHESVLEHASITVLFVIDRGVSHELVRHRLCAFSQESTRYCNYGKTDVTFVLPSFWAPKDPTDASRWKEEYIVWKSAMQAAEKAYLDLLAMGAKPEEARTVLPNSLKTEIVVTANLREWRHILKLRASPKAHPQMQQVMRGLGVALAVAMPCVFEGPAC